MKVSKTSFLIATASILLSVGVGVSSANASQPKSLPTVSSATGIISNGFNFCLGLGTSVKIGSPIIPVVNVSCTANTSVVVTKSTTTTGYTIAIADKCLFLASRTNGSDLFASTCGLAANWFALSAGGIGLVPLSGDGVNSNFCMDVEIGTPKIGSPIQIYTCQGLTGGLRIPAQRWKYPEALFNQSPYPYPDKSLPQPLPVATTPVTPTSPPKTCNNVGMCTANDVLERIRLITSVKDQVDPSLPNPKIVQWKTEEPWYGKDVSRFLCSADEGFDYLKSDATDFVISGVRNENIFNSAPPLGTMFRVRNAKFKANLSIPGSYLKSVVVQTTHEGLCQRFYADVNGWIIIPRYCDLCLLYGFNNSDWPTDSVVEVADISSIGRGWFATIAVKNPKKMGPSRKMCAAIYALGSISQTLKFATQQVAGTLPSPANLIVGQAISMYFDVIDPPTPNGPQLTKTIAAFGNAATSKRFFLALQKVKGSQVKEITKLKIEFYSTALDFGNLVAGHHSVITEGNKICR